MVIDRLDDRQGSHSRIQVQFNGFERSIFELVQILDNEISLNLLSQE